jgi:hypothetical protein
VERIEEIDRDAVLRVANRVLATTPTLATLGPVGRVAGYESIKSRLA